ncbi:MAG: cadherin domain-containing protein, partial [Ekhidna sp.]|nr:cadherin domain-containing protein [Ekhidna sp.]
TAVGTVQADDADMDNLMFAITAGNTGDVFDINRTTGGITTAGSLDFETDPTYTLTVSVSDGNLSATADITINVTDVDETATTRQAIANDIETLKGKQDGHLRTTNIADAQMKIAALQNESPTTAATYKAAVDAITAVTALDDATLTALQGEITAIEGRITALEIAGNAPAGTLQPLKDGLAARKTAQTNLSKSASELTTELRKITVSEEIKTMALQTTLNASNKDWDAIFRLINEGADVNAKDIHGNPALILAADAGQTTIVNALLKVDGIKVNILENNGATALMLAVRGGHIAVVTSLITAKADVNIQTPLNFTALDFANSLTASEDKTAIITALRNAGAKTKANLDGE